MDTFAQVAIFISGITAIYLTQTSRRRLHKYACLFGLAGQPFWFYATLDSHQLGMFALSVAYTLVWLLGFYNHWVSRIR